MKRNATETRCFLLPMYIIVYALVTADFRDLPVDDYLLMHGYKEYLYLAHFTGRRNLACRFSLHRQ